MKKIRLYTAAGLVTGLLLCASSVTAQTTNVVQDSFTGTSASTSLGWASFNGACLTAGTGTAAQVPGIPACNGLAYYGSQTQVGLTNNADTSGSGALRLTNLGDQNGAIVSTIPFPSDQGLQVTFTTYSYGGDSGGTAKDGADGIGFYLINGNDAANVLAAAQNPGASPGVNKWTLGAFGGSLGYSCSNSNNPHDGMTDAYIGLGMDEFGNFLNTSDNTATGDPATSTNGGNGATYQPQRIGLRGYGNLNTYSLQALVNAAGNSYTVTQTDVTNACKTGTFTYQTAAAYTTYTYSYSVSNFFNSAPYSGTLYQRSGNNGSYSYTAAGSTISGATTATNGGYTGSGTAYGLINGSYYSVNISSSTSTVAAQSTSVNVADYAAIPNGYFNLPTSTPIANESTTVRTSATPISYKLQITQDGLLSLAYSYNGGTYTQVLAPTSIASNNGSLPTSFLFGFGGSTGGDRNVHEITCFQATPANLSASSVGINVQQTSQVTSGTQVYLAYYHPNNWWGELDAQNLLVDPTTGAVSIQSTANWDASCVLTGGACPAVSATATYTAQGPGSRNTVTWSGGPNDANSNTPAGIPFNWGRLTQTEQLWLSDDSSLTNGSARVDYLNGNRTNEINTSGSGIFRGRTSVLGDIIDSSPTWVGPPSLTYPATWKDLLNQSGTPTPPENGTSAQTYQAFQTAEATRINVVFDGANDGFMHAFEAGYYNADGTYAGTTTNGVFTGTLNDGKELGAYIPEAIVRTIHNNALAALDYSSTHYSHNYFVDSTPGTGDLFYGNKWHTWLVSGLGAGGNAIFALDITDLGNTSNSTTFGAGNAVGEWSTVTTTSGNTSTTATTLVCATDTKTSQCGNNLGQTYGTPQIRRLHNGLWAIIFGNGLNSVTGHAGIYIMTISSTGSPSNVYFLDTGVGSTTNPNGIAYVSPVDLDGDHIADYVYAGDLLGNVWRFDLTSPVAGNWAVSTFNGTGPTPLFTTPSTNSSVTVNGTTTSVTTTQPITTQLVVLAVSPSNAAPSNSAAPRVMVEFGTGLANPQTATAAATYAPGQQALYGIWDWDYGLSGTAGAAYAGVAGTSNAPSSEVTLSQLQQQSVTSTTSSVINGVAYNFRTVSNSVMCLTGSVCTTTSTDSSGAIVTNTTAGTQFGWYMNLPGYAGVTGVGGNNQTEQVIYSPVEEVGAFLADTTIPANNSPLTCSALSASGYTMALNPANGGAFTQSFFSTSGNGTFGNNPTVSGIALGAAGSPSVVSNGQGGHALVSQTTTGVPAATPVNPTGPFTGGRLTWIQLH